MILRKQRFFFAAAALILMLSAHWPASAQETIRWQPFDTGNLSAKADKKKMMIHFYADWCRYCKKMAAETFSDKAVIEALNNNYIAVRVDSDRQKQIAGQFRVRGLPDTWFIGEDGVPIGNRVGFISAKQLMKILGSLP